MELMRWKEFMRDICYIFHISIADIAEGTRLSKRTVENTLSATNDIQPLRETVRLIENFVLGIPGEHYCYKELSESHDVYKRDLDSAVSRLAELQMFMQEHQHDIDQVHESYKEELRAVRETYTAERESLRAAHKRELDACRCDLEELLEVYKDENKKKDKIIAKVMGI